MQIALARARRILRNLSPIFDEIQFSLASETAPTRGHSSRKRFLRLEGFALQVGEDFYRYTVPDMRIYLDEDSLFLLPALSSSSSSKGESLWDRYAGYTISKRCIHKARIEKHNFIFLTKGEARLLLHFNSPGKATRLWMDLQRLTTCELDDARV